jgi:16S rRNA (uracil1498-N3)-methyltransferase
MPVERFYADHPLTTSSSVPLEGPELHHLRHVLRIQCGETVELVNGKGGLATATVEAIHKQQAFLKVQQHTQEPPAPLQILIAQAIPRLNRLDCVLEKGTELGMTQLWLFPGQRSERKTLTSHQLTRLRLLTVAAMKQCGRLYLPKIVVTPPLDQWKSPPEYRAFFGDLNPNAPPFVTACHLKPSDQGILFYVGPEGGFTPQEIEKLQMLKATGVKLHQNILRTDTAPLVALSLIAHIVETSWKKD